MPLELRTAIEEITILRPGDEEGFKPKLNSSRNYEIYIVIIISY